MRTNWWTTTAIPIEAFILTVTQKAAPKIEDNRSGDSLAIITINEKIQKHDVLRYK